MKNIVLLLLLIPVALCGQTYSSQPATGWAQYTDGLYTSGSPLTVLAGDTATLFNNAATTIVSEMPAGIDSLWSRTDSTFTPQNSGDSYLIRIDLTAESSSNDGYFSLALDIGGSQGIILNRLQTFPKGLGTAHKFTTTNSVYTLGTFLANGGKFKIIGGGGTTTVYDVNFVFTRTHSSP